MELGSLWRLLLRRWLILVIGLALAAGGTVAVYRVAPRSYQAAAQGLLLLPPDANNPALETSPFLYLPQGLNVLGRIVNQRMQTPNFHREMKARGYHADYQLGMETQTPVISITVEGAEPEDTLRTRDELMNQFSEILAEVQRNESVPERQFAHVRFLDTSDEPTVISGDRLRAAAVVGAVGALLVLLIAVAWDRFAERRRPRRKNASAPPAAFDPFGERPGEAVDSGSSHAETPAAPEDLEEGSGHDPDGDTAALHPHDDVPSNDGDPESDPLESSERSSQRW